MNPMGHSYLLANWLSPIDAGIIESKLLVLSLLGLTLGLPKIVRVCWAWQRWGGELAAVGWATLFVYVSFFCFLTFLPWVIHKTNLRRSAIQDVAIEAGHNNVRME